METSKETKLFYISPAVIDPNPWQPRRYFEESELQNLAKSLRQDGIIQPIVISKHPVLPNRYFVLAGERRLRAAKIAGLSEIPVTLKRSEYTEEEQLRLALIENIQRSNLNILEEGRAYKYLIERFGYTHEECAKKLGKDRLTITNALRVLSLPEEIHDDIVTRKISAGHARVLAGLSVKTDIFTVREQILKKGLSVRQAERLCRELKSSRIRQQKESGSSRADMDYIQRDIEEKVGFPVEIKGSFEKGKISLSYYSREQFERLIEILKHKSTAN